MHALWSMCFCVTGIYTLDQVPLCHIIYPLVQVPLCHWNINIHWSKYLCITCICPLVHVLLYHWHTFITTGPCTSVSLALYIHWSMYLCVSGMCSLVHIPLCQWHILWLGIWLTLGGVAAAWLMLGMVCTIWVVADSLSLAGAAMNSIFVATNTCLSLVCPVKLVDKTCLLWWQKNACRDKTFVATKLFVTANICHENNFLHLLQQKWYLCPLLPLIILPFFSS